jgi:hypothetical protein
MFVNSSFEKKKLEMVKSKRRNWLSDERLENCLQVAAQHTCPDFENLVAKQQWKTHHWHSPILQNKTVHAKNFY